MLTRRRLLALGQLGGGGVAPPASYTYPEGTLFGEVERLDTSGDYSLECGSGGESLPVEFVNNAAGVTISADTDWGNATADQRLLAVRVRGDLTIDEGYSLTAAARKLGLLIFVDGNLTVNGIIDMSARGANHSATGSNLTAFDVRLYEASAEVANVWPAAGAAGGAAVSNNNNGNTGSAGTNGQTGGGGGGGSRLPAATSGAGAVGSAYAGGPGGGGSHTNVTPLTGGSGNAVGGAGGDGAAEKVVSRGSGGGAGNPGGAGDKGTTGNVANAGANGVGGTLIVVALGAITIGATGIVRSNGSAGGDGQGGAVGAGGGGSGGGSISLYHVGAYSSAGTVQANGGAGGNQSWDQRGGAGGAGSIREVTL